MTRNIERRPILGDLLSGVIGHERWHFNGVWHSNVGVSYDLLIRSLKFDVTQAQRRKEIGSAGLHRQLGTTGYLMRGNPAGGRFRECNCC